MLRTITPTKARAHFYQLLKAVHNSHEPVYVHCQKHGVVMVAEEDWRAIEETLYLISIPKMRRKILAGGATPIEKCEKDLPWESGK